MNIFPNFKEIIDLIKKGSTNEAIAFLESKKSCVCRLIKEMNKIK